MGVKGVPVEGALWLTNLFSEGHGNSVPESPREILVLRPNDFGDLLTTTPIFEALHHRFPSSRIIAGVGSWGVPVLENNPYVAEVVKLDAPWNNKFVKDRSWGAVVRFLRSSEQVKQLRERKGFDVCIDVLGSHVGAALMMRLGARYKVGVRGYRGGWSTCQQYIRFSDEVHVSRAALAQAELLGAMDLPEARPQIFLTHAERAEAARIWSGADRGRLKILVGSGGGLEEKCWAAGNWGKVLADVSRMAEEQGMQAPDIVLVGGPGDRERASQIEAVGGEAVRSVCGETTLRITFALAEQADLVLTNPSMLLHVAAAFRRPTVTVLGGPYSDPQEHDRLWGYPPPYESVAPKEGGGWPSAEAVTGAVQGAISRLQQARSGRS